MISLRVLLSVLCCWPTLALARSAGDGSAVGNGGGLSEQALVYAGLHYTSSLQACLKYPACSRTLLRPELLELRSCQRPQVSQFVFSEPGETPELKDKRGEPMSYYKKADGAFVINRQLLFTSTGEAFNTPQGFAYLTRLFLDHCGLAAFAETQAGVEPLSDFFRHFGEQVTIGKDNLNLPAPEWIRLRTLGADILLESSEEILRLSCPAGLLENCTLLDPVKEEVMDSSYFRNLSLAREELESDGSVAFQVEGEFFNLKGEAQAFILEGRYENGTLQNLSLSGRELVRPESP